MKNLLDFMEEKSISKTHKNIIEKGIELGVNDSFLLENYKDFLKYKHLMHNNKISFENFFKKEAYESKEAFEKGIEFFGDKVQNTILINKAKKLKHSVMSNKYSHLEYEGVNEAFQILVEENISRDVIQKFLTKKLAAIYSPFEFEDSMNKFINDNISWEREHLLSKIKRMNKKIEILSDEDNKLLLKVNSFEESKKLGSRMWCITREERHFNNYTSDLNFFCFLYDFNKSPQDKNSMQAIIINPKETDEIYLKDDTLVERSQGFDPYLEFDLEFKSKIPKLSDEEIRSRYIKSLKTKQKPFFRTFLSDETKELLSKSKNAVNYFYNLKSPLYEYLDENQKEDFRKKNNEINNFEDSLNQDMYNELLRFALTGYSLKINELLELTLKSKELDEMLKKNNSTYDKKEAVNFILEVDNLKFTKYKFLTRIKENNVFSKEEFGEIFKNKKHLNFQEMLFVFNKDKELFKELKETKDLKNIFNNPEKTENTFLLKELFLKDKNNLLKDSLDMVEELGIKEVFETKIIEDVFLDYDEIGEFFKNGVLLDKEKINAEIELNVSRKYYSPQTLNNLLSSKDKDINKIAEKIIESDGARAVLSKIHNSSLLENEFKKLARNRVLKFQILKEADQGLNIKDFTDYQQILTIFNNKEAIVFNEKIRNFFSERVKKLSGELNEWDIIETYYENEKESMVKDMEVIIEKTKFFDEEIKKEIKIDEERRKELRKKKKNRL